MKKLLTLLALLSFTSLNAMTLEESKTAMLEKEVQLTKDGYKYIPPSDEDKNGGVALYVKQTKCEGTNDCGFKVKYTTKPNIANWSRDAMRIPPVVGKKNTVVKITGFHNVEMQNESPIYVCIKYLIGVAADPDPRKNNTAHILNEYETNACMYAGTHYSAQYELYVAAQFDKAGIYTTTAYSWIHDGASPDKYAHSTAKIS